jgi:hypothetical protein
MANVFAISSYTADKVQQPVSERGLAVIHVGDDVEVTNVRSVHTQSAGDRVSR